MCVVPNKLDIIHDSDRFQQEMQYNKYGFQNIIIENRNP